MPRDDRTVRLPRVPRTPVVPPVVWPARVSVPVLLSVIVALSWIGPDQWPIAASVSVCVLLLCVATRVPVTSVLHRVWQISPMLVGVSLAPAASHGFTAGWELSTLLLLRGLASLVTACWLTAVTPFADLVRLLRACRAPQAFVEVLSLTHRYLSVLSDELRQMRTAQRARTFGGESTWQGWRRRSQLVAALLSRSMNRAERVHLAMQARGYRGDHREPQ